MTVDEYFALPESNLRQELIDGELIVSPTPRRPHQRVAKRLGTYLSDFVEQNGLGEVFDNPLDFILNDGSVLQPDITFIPRDHSQYHNDDEVLSEPPALVIEILSPGSIKRYLKVKYALYEKAGVPHYWVVDPEREIIEAWALVKNKYQPSHKMKGRKFHAPPFAQLAIDLDKLFKQPE